MKTTDIELSGNTTSNWFEFEKEDKEVEGKTSITIDATSISSSSVSQATIEIEVVDEYDRNFEMRWYFN